MLIMFLTSLLEILFSFTEIMYICLHKVPIWLQLTEDYVRLTYVNQIFYK